MDNWYESGYESSKESLGDLAYFIPNSRVKKKDVKIRTVTVWENWNHYIEEAKTEGYIPIGSCWQTTNAYYRPDNFPTPWVLAIDQAANVGADLVIVCRDETQTEQKRHVTDTFGISTGNTYNYTTGNSYGTAVGGPYGTVGNSYGNTTGWSNSFDVYSGTSRSYDQYLWRFRKGAVFFRKGNFDSFYGAVVEPSHPMYPDETLDSHIIVNVVYVIKGSRAERDDIRKGQRVVRLNGKPIETYRDLERIPLHAISSVEVEGMRVEGVKTEKTSMEEGKWEDMKGEILKPNGDPFIEESSEEAEK